MKKLPRLFAGFAMAFLVAAAQGEDATPQRARDITFDDIKFDMEKNELFERSMLTPKIEKLAGKKIRIRGWMLPLPFKDGLTKFTLVRDNQECCFGPGAYLFDCILVDMSANQSTDFTTRPITVEGTFDIKEVLGPRSKHLAVYQLTADKVK